MFNFSSLRDLRSKSKQNQRIGATKSQVSCEAKRSRVIQQRRKAFFKFTNSLLINGFAVFDRIDFAIACSNLLRVTHSHRYACFV
ncbi:MAG: hypothetical protein IKH66_01550 [Campylobacter sp.]|nr:hypothetical protein [Campylobacter sp.]